MLDFESHESTLPISVNCAVHLRMMSVPAGVTLLTRSLQLRQLGELQFVLVREQTHFLLLEGQLLARLSLKLHQRGLKLINILCLLEQLCLEAPDPRQQRCGVPMSAGLF